MGASPRLSLSLAESKRGRCLGYSPHLERQASLAGPSWTSSCLFCLWFPPTHPQQTLPGPREKGRTQPGRKDAHSGRQGGGAGEGLVGRGTGVSGLRLRIWRKGDPDTPLPPLSFHGLKSVCLSE